MLMGVVIALVSALVGMVSGFTIGLGNDTVSALRAMPTDSMVFAKGTSDFTRSVLTGDQVSAWARHSGVNAHPLGIGIFHGETSDDSSVDMAVIGAEPHSPLLPATTHGRQVVAPGEVVVSEGLADSGFASAIPSGSTTPTSDSTSSASPTHSPTATWQPHTSPSTPGDSYVSHPTGTCAHTMREQSERSHSPEAAHLRNSLTRMWSVRTSFSLRHPAIRESD